MPIQVNGAAFEFRCGKCGSKDHHIGHMSMIDGKIEMTGVKCLSCRAEAPDVKMDMNDGRANP